MLQAPVKILLSRLCSKLILLHPPSSRSPHARTHAHFRQVALKARISADYSALFRAGEPLASSRGAGIGAVRAADGSRRSLRCFNRDDRQHERVSLLDGSAEWGMFKGGGGGVQGAVILRGQPFHCGSLRFFSPWNVRCVAGLLCSCA